MVYKNKKNPAPVYALLNVSVSFAPASKVQMLAFLDPQTKGLTIFTLDGAAK